MSNKESVLFCCVLLVGLGLSFNTSACSIQNWDVKVGITDANAGSPTAVSRFENLCALEITADETYVQDNSPIDGDDTRIRLRFYLLVDSDLGDTSEVTILQAFDDDSASNLAFAIDYLSSGANMLNFRNGAGGNVTVPAPDGWIFIEVDWEVAVGFKFWVNTEPTEAATGDPGVGGSATYIGMVQLGAPTASGLGDINKLTFDSYQANRTNPVGELLVCDADGSGLITLVDNESMVDETFYGTPLAPGVPDCDRNGEINLLDVEALVDLIF